VKKLAFFGVVVALVGFQMLPGRASSHREAPLISQDPTADNTDLYAWVDATDTSKVNIVANYIPLEQPAGGPNFPAFDDNVLYEIHVDNNGDGDEDLTYQFRFTTETRNPETFLYNVGPIASLGDTNWNRPQFYDVKLVRALGAHGLGASGQTLGTHLPTPPDNIGPRSTPNYDALAAAAVNTLPGGIKVFAGQRDDPFFVDLGSIFDLAGLRPFNPFHLIPLPAAAGVDGVQKFNAHTIAIQIPISQLVPAGGNPSIGIYASASRQEVRILRRDGDADNHGKFVQVSRLGEPLINEVIIPLGDKDEWNREDPGDDQRFDQYYLNPEVARLENLLYGTPPQGHPGGALLAIDEHNRGDLVAILLTGVPGLNFTGDRHADLLRLNTAIKPGAQGACPGGVASNVAPDRLGVLSGDLCGFPNGRRLGDDVVDIELRAVAQGYGAFLNGLLGLPNKSPNNLVGDGVDANDKPFLSVFPYVPTPWQGYLVP